MSVNCGNKIEFSFGANKQVFAKMTVTYFTIDTDTHNSLKVYKSKNDEVKDKV